jgi:hypothetical protein
MNKREVKNEIHYCDSGSEHYCHLDAFYGKRVEEFAGNAGIDIAEKAKSTLNTIKARPSGDQLLAESLAYFEKEPERYQPYIENVLMEKLAIFNY